MYSVGIDAPVIKSANMNYSASKNVSFNGKFVGISSHNNKISKNGFNRLAKTFILLVGLFSGIASLNACQKEEPDNIRFEEYNVDTMPFWK